MNRLQTGLLFLMTALTAGCGNQVVEFLDGAGPDANGPPTITSTLPVNGAIDVAIGTSVAATFSKQMNASTLNATSFTVRQGTTNVAGAISYAAGTRTATFAPAAPLDFSRVYTATVTTAAQDLAGTGLAINGTWSFTTAGDPGPPMVISNTPLDGAVNVTVNKRPTATFSKAMNPATINATTFTLAQGLNPISGAVTLDALTNTATFTPAAPLDISLLYTATITTGAQDTGGQQLVAAHVWDFTTGACSMATIDLGGAARFAVLANQSITNAGLTEITGDIGTDPGTSITGFGTGNPGIVTGATFAGGPEPQLGIADLTTAYNDAAGRTLCSIAKSGNIGGQTLAPGLYTSAIDLAVSSGDLTLDAQGDPDAVWIFQAGSTLDLTSGRQVVLTNGAKASNIFWQVGSSATLGSTVVFHGTIMAEASVTMVTGASLDGRALARTASVTLDDNTIVLPAP